MREDGNRSFELIGIDKGKAEIISIFANRKPRNAALKAANRGHKLILLRERNRAVQKVHVFKGDVQTRDSIDSDPDWIKKIGFIRVPTVKKLGIIKFKKRRDILPGLLRYYLAHPEVRCMIEGIGEAPKILPNVINEPPSGFISLS